MSPKIPVTRPCAAPCRRIEIVASRRIAAAWVLWASSICAVVWFAVDLPWLVRGTLVLATAGSNASSLCRCVLLLGSQSVRVLEWQEQGEFTVLLGDDHAAHPAALAAGSFRLGGLLALRFAVPGGLRAVLIDGNRQEPRAFRRLCRHLGNAREGAKTGGSGRSRESN